MKILMAEAGASGGTPAPAGAAAAPPPAAPSSAGSPGTQTPAGGAPQDWTTGFNDDLKGYVTNKGFQNPAAVVESYRNFEKLQGVPRDRILKLPEDMSDAAAMGEVYNRLGRPEKPEGYGLAPKEKGGDPKFSEWAGKTFHELGLTGAQGKALAEKLGQFAENVGREKSDAQIAQNQAQEGELKKKWGAAFEQNINIAKRAVRDFQLDGETVDKLEDAMGFSKVMEFFNKVGSSLGEGSFHSGDGAPAGNGNGVMTPEAAKAKIAAAQQDPEFVKRYLANEMKAKEQMKHWHKMANPDSN